MLSANLLDLLIKVFVGIKNDLFIDHRAILSGQVSVKSQEMLVGFLAPAIFSALWVIIATIAHSKNGDYKAPPGMLYMQDQAEL